MITPTTDELIVEYFDLKDRAAAYDARIKEIVATLRALGAGTHVASTGTIKVTPPMRFSPELAAEKLPPELVAACSETVITASKAKLILAPALYQACSKQSGDARVSITPA